MIDPQTVSQTIHRYAELSLLERTGKQISRGETVIVTSPQNEICRIIHSRGRTFASVSEQYVDVISKYLATSNISKEIRSPSLYVKILKMLNIDCKDFRLEPMDELVENIEYNCTHSLEYICSKESFVPRDTQFVTKISRGDERFNIRIPSVEAMHCILENDHIISSCFSRPNPGVFSNTCAMGVFTDPEHRKQGFGKDVVASATYEVVSDQKLALWVCQVENEASKRLACAVGYQCLGGELRIYR